MLFRRTYLYAITLIDIRPDAPGIRTDCHNLLTRPYAPDFIPGFLRCLQNVLDSHPDLLGFPSNLPRVSFGAFRVSRSPGALAQAVRAN